MEKHIIHKVYLELTTSSASEAQKLKDTIGSFLNSEVFPLLEKQMDVIDEDMSSYAIQLDKVHVEITEKNIRLQEDLKHTLVQKIEEETQKTVKSIENEQKHASSLTKGKSLHKNEHQLETFIHFLKTGTNPWWSNESITKLLAPKKFKELLATRGFATKIIRVLRSKKVRERVMNQLTRESVKELCVVIAKEDSTIVDLDDTSVQQIKKRPVVQQQQIWKQVLDAIAYQETVVITALIKTIKETAAIAKTSQQQQQQQRASSDKRQEKDPEQQIILETQKINEVTQEQTHEQTQEQIKDSIEAKIKEEKTIKEKRRKQELQEAAYVPETVIRYTPNAGLVLINPFLIHFFNHCNLLDENKQLKDQELCVHLLHYIATGKTKQAESDMVFEKFLCDIPLYKTINRNITITKKQKEQAHNLLNAVNENWGALKKSSHALLRNEFLQRLGKIEKNSSGITIEMEHKTQDILLRKLSWGMGLIKFPWKKEYVYVNW